MKFLLVDDSSTMRKIVGLALKSGEYLFEEAESAEIALEKISKEKYDFFLIDVNMPGMNGIELTKKIRGMSNYQKTPIIILTTEKEESFISLGKSAGANDWIVKPFQKEALLEQIKKYLA